MVFAPQQPFGPDFADRPPAGQGWREASVSCTDEGRRLIETVTAAMAADGYVKKDVFEFRLALEEAIVNAIKHGHRGDPNKRVRVTYQITVERVVAEIEDEGPGFNPTLVPDPTAPENVERPGGRGLFLIRAYMSWMRFNDRGNKVAFCKARSPI